MAINSLTFANGLVYEDFSGNFYGSVLIYNATASAKTYRLSEFKQVNFELTSTPQTKRLFTYKDESYVEIEYTYTKTPQSGTSMYYAFDAHFRAYDKDGNMIKEALASRSTTVNTQHMQVEPFTEAYYFGSSVDYATTGQQTLVNDPANTAELMGFMLWKNPQPPAGGYLELQKGLTVKENVLDNSYTNWISGIGIVTSDQAMSDYFGDMDPNNEWHDVGDVPDEPDPSGPGGGDTPSGDTGDSVDFPSIPGTSVLSTGLLALYAPTAQNLRDLAAKLWSNDFESSISKILNDPFDGIIGLSMVPFTPTTSGNVNCFIGNYDSEISMPIVSEQYVTISAGSVTVKENWKNALDYNATSIDIYIPFVGFRPLSIEDCMGKTLELKYNIDVLNGSGVAVLKCGNKCLYNYPCKVSYDVPLTGSNKAALYTGLINVALTGLSGAAAGGVMGAVGGAAASAINVATSKQSSIERSGAITSNTGMLADFVPYIVLHRPIQSLPKDFKKIKGYMSNISMTLSACSGYTEVEYIHLTGISGATDTELNEIEQLLKGGVII